MPKRNEAALQGTTVGRLANRHVKSRIRQLHVFHCPALLVPANFKLNHMGLPGAQWMHVSLQVGEYSMGIGMKSNLAENIIHEVL